MPDLILAADCVLGKIGYGFVSECMTCLTPLVYIKRSHWAEEQHLQAYLDTSGLGVHMHLADFEAGDWGSYLAEALALRSGKHSTHTGRIPDSVCSSAEHSEVENSAQGAHDSAGEEICSMVRDVLSVRDFDDLRR
jgi:L-arabinokinase